MTKRKDQRQEQMAKGLTGLVADTYVLYNSTQACHWNVEGPQFHSLHELFEKQYREMAEAIDTLAERVRALGFYTPATLAHMTKLSRIRQPEELRDSQDMLRHLIESHEQIVHRASELRGEAEEALDEVTAGMLVDRLTVHEKALWMLRSQAGQDSAELTLVDRMARAG